MSPNPPTNPHQPKVNTKKSYVKSMTSDQSHPDPIREAIRERLYSVANFYSHRDFGLDGSDYYGVDSNLDEILAIITTHYTPKAPVTEQPIRELDITTELADEMSEHWIRDSINLGQYKSELHCACGDNIILDEHANDWRASYTGVENHHIAEKLKHLISATYLPKSQVAGMVREAVEKDRRDRRQKLILGDSPDASAEMGARLQQDSEAKHD